MAETTLPEQVELTERDDVLLDAAYELDKLARMIPALVPRDEDGTYYAVRGLCGRMLRLTKVLFDGLGDGANADTLKLILDVEGLGQG